MGNSNQMPVAMSDQYQQLFYGRPLKSSISESKASTDISKKIEKNHKVKDDQQYDRNQIFAKMQAIKQMMRRKDSILGDDSCLRKKISTYLTTRDSGVQSISLILEPTEQIPLQSDSNGNNIEFFQYWNQLWSQKLPQSVNIKSLKFNNHPIFSKLFPSSQIKGYGILQFTLQSASALHKYTIEAQFTKYGDIKDGTCQISAKSYKNKNGSKNLKQSNLESQKYFRGEVRENVLSGMGNFRYNSSLQRQQQYKYEGQWRGNVPFGMGQFSFTIKQKNRNQSQYRYIGELVNNQKHGSGIYFYHGHIFDGNFLNDQISGHCTMHNANGDKYCGQWRENKKDGYGKYQWKNGCIYQGIYWNNKKHGYGVMYYQPQKNIKKQQNKQNKYNNINNPSKIDKCEQIKRNIYKGMWKNGLKHGKGVLQYYNGKIIKGRWEEGKFMQSLQ